MRLNKIEIIVITIYICYNNIINIINREDPFMASAKNQVIAGEFTGKYIKYGFINRYVVIQKIPSYTTNIELNSYSELEIRKSNVIQYEVVTEEKIRSASSAIIRGAAGATILGPVGLLAGLTAKNKGIHTLAIEWINGKKSLIEVDEKIYKQLITDLF